MARVTEATNDTQLVEQTSLHSPQLEWPFERIIVPMKRRLRVADLLRHREVVQVLAARDFKVKYKQSLLGPLWLVFQPLALLVAFVVAFRGLGDVRTSGVPYAVFALAGLSVWTFFQAAMTIGAASMITNSSFVRFTPCPRPAFPLAAIIASLPSVAVTAAGAIGAAAVSGILSPRVLLLPLGLAWLLILTAGCVGIAASLATRYRDIISALPFLLQVGLFFAPLGYSLSGLSSFMRKVVELNPITGIVETWRWMMLDGYEPHLPALAIAAGMTVLVAVAGWRTFSRLETTMADVI
jgi:lipopolysaccharide transport system permease protein